MRNESAGHQLAAPISRRGLLRSTLGGAVGAAVAGRSGSAADAVKPPKKLLLEILTLCSYHQPSEDAAAEDIVFFGKIPLALTAHP